MQKSPFEHTWTRNAHAHNTRGVVSCLTRPSKSFFRLLPLDTDGRTFNTVLQSYFVGRLPRWMPARNAHARNTYSAYFSPNSACLSYYRKQRVLVLFINPRTRRPLPPAPPPLPVHWLPSPSPSQSIDFFVLRSVFQCFKSVSVTKWLNYVSIRRAYDMHKFIRKFVEML